MAEADEDEDGFVDWAEFLPAFLPLLRTSQVHASSAPPANNEAMPSDSDALALLLERCALPNFLTRPVMSSIVLMIVRWLLSWWRQLRHRE